MGEYLAVLHVAMAATMADCKRNSCLLSINWTDNRNYINSMLFKDNF